MGFLLVVSPPCWLRDVPYYRVSTQRQGHSGLGLEALQYTVQCFLKPEDMLTQEFIEVEKDKRDSRLAQKQQEVQHLKTGIRILGRAVAGKAEQSALDWLQYFAKVLQLLAKDMARWISILPWKKKRLPCCT